MKSWSEISHELTTLETHARAYERHEIAERASYLAEHGHDMQEQQIRSHIHHLRRSIFEEAA